MTDYYYRLCTVTSKRISTRRFLIKGCLGLIASATGCATEADGNKTKKKPIAQAAPFVKPKEKWGPGQLYEFLYNLPEPEMLTLMKLMEIVDPNATEGVMRSKQENVQKVLKQLLWVSNDLISYQRSNENNQNYHELVKWVAKSSGVSADIMSNASTFKLEIEIQKQIFVKMWDKLSPEQRLELLSKIDPNGQIKDKASIIALGGAGAIAVLSTTVFLSGFAFYTTMTITMSTVAGFFGLTLPFAAYTSASTLVAVLSGPVGWVIGGIALLGSVAYAGSADIKKTTLFIMQLHDLKIQALQEAGVPENEVFK